MNVELLREVQVRIRQHPYHFNMEMWIDDIEMAKSFYEPYWKLDEGARSAIFGRLISEDESCGTTACIAGWAVACASNKAKELAKNAVLYSNSIFYNSMSTVAGKLLDLPNTDLFYAEYWPEPFKSEYDELTNKGYSYPETEEGIKRCAEIACEVIDHYIEHNGWHDSYDSC